MEHLNYCRQAARFFSEHWALDDEASATRALMSAATKFLLPPGGVLLEDFDLRALDRDTPLMLPYDLVALEYSTSQFVGEGRTITKGIVLAWDDGDRIATKFVGYSREADSWAIAKNTIHVPKQGFVRDVDRKAELRILRADGQQPMASDGHAPFIVLSLLNALACSNVRVETSAPSKVRRAMQKRGALPFDTYHVLTIDVPRKDGDGAATGGHRSPREHLRRGHIRRLGDGRRIWVNATVVAAGRGAGVVTKDYALRHCGRT